MIFYRFKFVVFILLTSFYTSAQNNNQFTYLRVDKSFKIFNTIGDDITNQLTDISNFNSMYQYMYEPQTKSILKLSYARGLDKKAKAEVVFKSKEPNLVHLSEYDGISFYCEGKFLRYEEVNKVTPNRKVFFMSPKSSKYTYKFLFTEGKSGVVKLDKLEPNIHNAYWCKILRPGDVSKSDINIFINAGNVNGDELFISYSPNSAIGLRNNGKYYGIKLKDYKSAQIMKINALKEISIEEYESIKSNSMRSELRKIGSTTKNLKNKSNNGEIDKSSLSPIEKCNSNIQCLITLSEKAYSSGYNQNKNDNIAYLEMSKVFLEVYQSNPENMYNMLMNIEDKYVLGIMKQLPKEVRAYIRNYANKEVEAYVKKNGAPKIKTVPYKPKNNN